MRLYLLRHGTDELAVRFLTRFFRKYGIDRQYDQKKIRKALKKGFWYSEGGEIQLKVLKEL